MAIDELGPIPLWPDNPTALDLLGFADIAEPVLDAVGRERLDPVAVGIFGDWGSGKTTILELIVEELRESEEVVVVYTQPWKYDPSLDPRASLIAEVLATLRERTKKDETRWDRTKQRFGDLAKRIQWSKAITLATRSAITFSPPSIEGLLGIFGSGEEPGDPTLQGFRDEFATLMEDLDDVQRVVVLVDDLDRCLPETVVMSLEAIKLFLSVPKMAFVIAADGRLVELAIAQRFGTTQQGGRMAREYLEKIVQIPVSVPALGLGDTEAYLSLMLLERHLDSSSEALRRLAAHCDERRRRAEPSVFLDVPSELVPDKAKPDLALAAMLAPVLYKELDGNPRRLKRFLNAFWIRSGIARRRGAAPEETALAKLMVLEQLEPDAFAQLLDWLGDGTLPEKLREIEDGKSPQGAHTAFEWWAQMPPKLAGVDLGPYLRLAASLRRRPGPRSELRPDLADMLDALQSPAIKGRSEAQKRLRELPSGDRIVMAREIVGVMRIEPGAQEHLAETFSELVSDPDLTMELVDGLRRMDPGRVDAGLIIAMGGDHPAAEQMRTIVREWRDGGSLDEIRQNAADEVLGDAD
jgi:hypothetical protein